MCPEGLSDQPSGAFRNKIKDFPGVLIAGESLIDLFFCLSEIKVRLVDQLIYLLNPHYLFIAEAPPSQTDQIKPLIFQGFVACKYIG